MPAGRPHSARKTVIIYTKATKVHNEEGEGVSCWFVSW